MKTLDKLSLNNEKVIVRVDFNVPLDADGNVTDDTRIRAAKPTVDYILSNGGSCILMSHLGRPEGKEEKYSLKHIQKTVSDILKAPVLFAEDCVGSEAQVLANNLQNGQVLLLENLRFYKEETSGDEAFAKQLSNLGSVYVNDAFGTAHRAHASTAIIASFFEGKKAFGKLLEKEVLAIEQVMNTGEKPVLAILGGAKVSSKITIIENILDKIDHLIIGGGMAYTFIKAQGGSIGDSLCEDDYLQYTRDLVEQAAAKNVKIHLPVDVVCTNDFANDAESQITPIGSIPDQWMGLDSGPESIIKFGKVIEESKTILWNGPVGVFEFENFSKGTIALGEAIAKSTAKGSFSLVGGGDSVAAVKQFGFEDRVSYVSTGGGAMLESLEGKDLPGIAALVN
ncbi:phosphoglycerate kinase [Flavobacteriaceae bacterium]|nr:phosphoglycerate kinase [Flavobacteriaceae bacterium]MDB4773504.1 phosphoglycerate kinase [Flavobacteriaceae bacterium]